MKMIYPKCRYSLVATIIFASFLTADLSAQMPSFFTSSKMSKDRKDVPTLVEADTMDIDIANNIATLLGNVDVDDQDMNIKCNKMIIYLEDKDEDKKVSNEDKKSGDPEENKQLSKIECIGDVVITRKFAVEGDAAGEAQKAMSGKAVYNLKDETITLTENPILVKGRDKLVAQKIVLFLREGGRMKITKGKTNFSGISPVSGTGKDTVEEVK